MSITELFPLEIARTSETTRSKKSEGTKAVVKSAERALQILEYFDGVQREACVSEISRALRYPQSSTSALLQSLVSLGYLQHDRFKRTYFPTRRVSLLGNWLDPALLQHGALLAGAEELARQSGQCVVMATANGLNAQYIHILRPHYASDEQDAFAIGALRPIASTAVGRALMSSHDDAYVAKFVRRINAERRLGEKPINIQDFLRQLRLDQTRGYFAGDGAGRGQRGLAATVDRSRQLLVIAMEGDRDTLLRQEELFASMLRRTTAPLPTRSMMLA